MATFGLIFALLGRLLASFWLSWGTFWPHFGSLGTPFGVILALLRRLGTPFWPKLAQVGPRWRKKLDFLSLISGSWHKLGAKNREKSMSKTTFFSDAFLTSIFIDLLSISDSENGRFFDQFLNLRRKRRFCKNMRFA